MLAEREFPLDDLVCLASPRSAGKRVRFGDDEVEVQAVAPEAFDGVDIALFSAGASRSREWAPIAVERGAVVVDNSSAFRMQPDVPLVVADVNPEAARDHRGIVANPNCSTMQLMPVLKPILDTVGIERVVISTYQAVSGTGQSAIDGLLDETEASLGSKTPRGDRLPAPDRVQRDPDGGLVRRRRRLHRRGAEARQRDAARSSARPTCACPPRASACRS